MRFRATRGSLKRLEEGTKEPRLRRFKRRVGAVQFGDLIAETAEQLRSLDRALDHQQQLRVVPGLFQVLEETYFIDGLNGALLVGVPGQQYTCRLRLQLFS